jgi:hypothetical protein
MGGLLEFRGEKFPGIWRHFLDSGLHNHNRSTYNSLRCQLAILTEDGITRPGPIDPKRIVLAAEDRGMRE